MYPSPLADTGNYSEGVTTTSIGVVDDPPDITTTTSTCPDDSEPTNSFDANTSLNPTQHITLIILIALYTHSLVVSMITPIALSLPPVVIAGPSDDGTFNIKSNVSFLPSANISSTTGTLTLLILISLPNVALIPPISQTLWQ